MVFNTATFDRATPDFSNFASFGVPSNYLVLEWEEVMPMSRVKLMWTCLFLSLFAWSSLTIGSYGVANSMVFSLRQ